MTNLRPAEPMGDAPRIDEHTTVEDIDITIDEAYHDGERLTDERVQQIVAEMRANWRANPNRGKPFSMSIERLNGFSAPDVPGSDT